MPVAVAYRRQARCYKCDGNNEQCSLAMMHSDIAKYTVRCPRDYDNCLTVFLEQDGRKIFNKRCASDRICNRETSRCGGSERATKGGLQTEKICHAWCCKGDWCNPGPPSGHLDYPNIKHEGFNDASVHVLIASVLGSVAPELFL
ncbi:hypothetical protein pdam_00003921 [Pocillopora damicornis]|uniref:Uncharacterized protein n=1 Tax=Pocillopora damicornis TaxID=46731 RepID=A0A3M6U6R3_POCDA|nr:hypothetical protein pdam_00003921 [Pocillopora damicornis]